MMRGSTATGEMNFTATFMDFTGSKRVFVLCIRIEDDSNRFEGLEVFDWAGNSRIGILQLRTMRNTQAVVSNER